MAMERNLITVPCENEDRPEKEDALDFDEDTLQGTQSLSQLTFRYQFHLRITSRHRKDIRPCKHSKEYLGQFFTLCTLTLMFHSGVSSRNKICEDKHLSRTYS